MRLVMLYTVSDGCTYSCDVVKPIEYESVEQARLDFGSKILEIEEKQSAYRKAYSQWENRINSLNNPEKKISAYKDRPTEPGDSFEFAGKSFSYSSFFVHHYNSETQESENHFCEPDFITLDQWYK